MWTIAINNRPYNDSFSSLRKAKSFARKQNTQSLSNGYLGDDVDFYFNGKLKHTATVQAGKLWSFSKTAPFCRRTTNIFPYQDLVRKYVVKD